MKEVDHECQVIDFFLYGDGEGGLARGGVWRLGLQMSMDVMFYPVKVNFMLREVIGI